MAEWCGQSVESSQRGLCSGQGPDNVLLSGLLSACLKTSDAGALKTKVKSECVRAPDLSHLIKGDF